MMRHVVWGWEPEGVFDFIRFDAKVIIEVDGAQHAENAADIPRDANFCHERLWDAAVLE